MFKKEFIYDFIENGYKGTKQFDDAVKTLIRRMKVAGYADVAEELSKIKLNKPKPAKKFKEIKTNAFDLYDDSINKKAELLFNGYTHNIINSAILYGKPGTGKTYFVDQFAKDCKLDVVSLNISSILDYRYGESIKKLEHFINTNKDKQQIIFLDEADSIFSSRGNKQDVFETSRIITTMLQLLDSPRKALIIFSTNLMEQIDKAIIRRFDIKINFNHTIKKPLDMLCTFLLEWNIKLSEDEKISLRREKINDIGTDYTIADIKLLSKRMALSKFQNESLIELMYSIKDWMDEMEDAKKGSK